MPSKVFSAAPVGLDARLIEVEVDACYGLPRFNIVGLPDKAVEESKERVDAAIKSAGLEAPHRGRRVLVNLAPADLKKEGALYDLPIALGYLLASKQIRFEPKHRLFIGELSLDGALRPIKGAIAFALLAQEMSYQEIVLPEINAAEAGLVSRHSGGLKVIGAQSLTEVIEYLLEIKKLNPFETETKEFRQQIKEPIDFGWIKGQEHAKRALEIAAAGGHNVLMKGPPGAGKTLLAKAITSILPELSFEECMEVTKIYSMAGLLPGNSPLMNLRPFRSPHHTTSEAALIGGGNPPRSGEITLAHQGVLFLDEFPEFHRDALESLRQPIEEGRMTILRAKHSLTFPAKFMLVAAANPCPCGNKGNSERECTCSSSQTAKYQRKLSGPLMDRIDLFVEVPQVKYEKLLSDDTEAVSPEIKKRVNKAREIQANRFALSNRQEDFSTNKVNSGMNIPQIKKHCSVDLKSQSLLKKYVDAGKLSARGYHRTLKIARTVADLEMSEEISFMHLSEALSYKLQDQQ